MKTLALLSTLSFFLLLNPTHSAFNPIRLPTAGEAVKSDTPVLDSDGDPVQADGAYIISSITWGAGAGEVIMGHLDSSNKCPSDVLSVTFESGTPVRFTPADENATVVLPSTYQTISFSTPIVKLCVSSLFWRIRLDAYSRQYFVRLGGFVSGLSDRFKIELIQPSINAYRITYCLVGTDKCYNVGRFFDTMARATRLVLTDDDSPFVVLFKKAR